MDTEILIVGAGPTGLMLANQLGRRGVRAMIIDRNSGPVKESRAMGVQARTLEIYAKLGLSNQALGLGAITDGVNLWSQGRHTARVPVGDAGKGLSRFPFVLMLGQDANERILGEKLVEWDIAVQWKTELIALEQRSDHVAVTLKQPDGTLRELTAGRVAGCDGARSRVRELCGIGFPGAPYEHVFFVADTIATGNMVPGELNAYLWKKGFHLFFPIRGKNRWRVIGILPAHLQSRDDLHFEDVLPHIRQETGANLAFQACNWFSTYRIHHRSAARFSDRRCFLLGDAAHIHSPMGAQGMNTGLQDAYNLGWKLAMVIRGEADETLLDSYAVERMRVAHTLLRGTDRVFGLVVSDTPLAAFFRTRIMGNIVRLAMRRESVRRLAFRTISQIGVRYRGSPLSHSLAEFPESAPHAGDRFPWLQVRLQANGPLEDLHERLDDTRFNLVVIGQPAPAAFSTNLDTRFGTHVVPADFGNVEELARARVATPSFYLLRPDGHVALAGTNPDIEGIERYFAEQRLFGARPAHAGARRTMPPELVGNDH